MARLVLLRNVSWFCFALGSSALLLAQSTDLDLVSVDPVLGTVARHSTTAADMRLHIQRLAPDSPLAVDGSDGQTRVGVLVQKTSHSAETSSRFEEVACVGTVCAGWIETDRLAEVTAGTGISRVGLSRKLWATHGQQVGQPSSHRSSPPMFAGGSSSNKTGGTGVLIAYVDTGIDIFHSDFRHSDGTTRIKYLLDLSVPGDIDGDGLLDGTGPYGGTEWNESAINTALDAGSFLSSDPTGHGTHGLSVSAGDDDTLPGVAPEADLIVVKATRVTDSLAFEAIDLIAALAWVDEKIDALAQPCVINLSLGSDFASHDGRSLEEMAIDEIAGPGVAGRAVVVAAGNAGTHDYGGLHHLRDEAFAGLTNEHQISIPSYTPNSGTQNDRMLLDVWFEGPNTLDLEVETPTGTIVTAPFGTSAAQATSDGSVLILNDGWSSPGSGDFEALLLIDDYDGAEVAEGTWKVRVAGAAVSGSATYDMWVVGLTDLGDLPGRPSITEGDPRSYVGKPGSSFSAITVGSHAENEGGSRFLTSWIDVDGTPRVDSTATDGELSGFSSTGLTRDGRIKPELTAPGERVLGAVSRGSFPTGNPDEVSLYKYHEWYPAEPNALILDATADGAFGVLQGTSFSAPVVAGLAARILEANPTWDGEQVRNALISSALTDGFTGATPNEYWGFGKADRGLGVGTAIPDPLRVTTKELSEAREDQPYRGYLMASGGTRPYSWTLSGGSLPTGLSVDPIGIITGTPTETGSFAVTIRVDDDNARWAETTLELEVRSATELRIITAGLATAVLGRQYSELLEAAGGSTPYTWTFIGATLPDGLALGTDGEITGTPTDHGEWCFTVQVEDDATTTQQTSLCITVDPLDDYDWDQRGLLGGYVTEIKVHPSNPDRVFAGTRGNGLYVSRNMGDSWIWIPDVPRDDVTDIVFSPHDPNTMYVVLRYSGISQSTDGGQSWLPIDYPYSVSQRDLLFLWVDLDDPDHLYVGEKHHWRESLDGGSTWMQHQVVNTSYGHQELVQDPNDHNRLYMDCPYFYGGNHVFVSEDRGGTWRRTLQGAEIVDMIQDPVDTNWILVGPGTNGVEGGAFRSSDHGETWELGFAPPDPVTGGASNFVYGPNSNDLYMATASGLWRSPDHGTTKSEIFFGRPGWEDARINSIDIDPTDENRIYLGTSRGVFSTYDGGLTWTRSTRGMLSAQVHRTGDSDENSVVLLTDDGVFESATAGNFWSRMDAPGGVNAVFYSPSVGRERLYLQSPTQIHVRDHNGLSEIGANIPGFDPVNQWISQVKVTEHLGQDRVVCLTTHDSVSPPGVLAYYSDDFGISWTEFVAPSYSNRLFVVNGAVFAGTVVGAPQGHLYRSLNWGSTWQQCTLHEVHTGGIGPFQVERFYQLKSNPADGSFWFTIHKSYMASGDVNQGCILRSTDGGLVFDSLKCIYWDTDITGNFFDFVFRNTGTSEVLVGTIDRMDNWGNIEWPRSGIWASDDFFATYSPRNMSFPGRTSVSRLMNQESGDLIIAGTAGAGVFTSSDGGSSWQDANTFSSIAASIQDVEAIDATTLVLASEGYGSYLSTDAGNTFSPNNQGLAGGFDMRSLFRDSDGTLWGATASGVFSQTTTGGTWTQTTLTDPVTDVVSDGSGVDRVLWATVEGQGVATSDDDGATWTISDTGLSSSDLTSLEVEQLGLARRIWVTSLGGNGVYFSDDDGATWEPVWGVGLGSLDVFDLGIEEGVARRIWVTTYNGVYSSSDDGRTWRDDSAGLPRGTPATSIAFDPLTGEALVGVNHAALGGVYRGGNVGGKWRPYNSGLEDRRINRLVPGASIDIGGGEFRTTFHAGTDGGGLFSTSVVTGTSGVPLSITTTSLPGGGIRAPYVTVLTATGGLAPYRWGAIEGSLPAGLDLGIDGTLSGTPLESGAWEIEVSVEDSYGSTETATLILAIAGPPKPEISGESTICVGESTMLDAGPGYVSYLWSTTETTQAITVSPLVDTEYSCEVIDSFGNSGSDDFMVTVAPLPSPNINGPTSMVAGDIIVLDAGVGYASYLWSTSETTQTISVSPAVTTIYNVTVTTAEGCSGASPDHEVVVYPLEDLIFRDGFEFGSTSNWSATTGG